MHSTQDRPASTGDRLKLTVTWIEAMFNNHDSEMVARHYASSYVEHNPDRSSGAGRLIELLESLSQVTGRVIQPWRAVEENGFVAIHSWYAWNSQLEVDGGLGTAAVDIFRFGPNDEIAEHWITAEPIRNSSVSGHGMMDGDGDPYSNVTTGQVAENKKSVRRLFKAFRTGNYSAVPAVVARHYIQHDPLFADGRQAMIDGLSARGPMDVVVRRMLGQGDLVFVQSYLHRQRLAIVDIFRFDDRGDIVEHWGVHQPYRRAA